MQGSIFSEKHRTFRIRFCILLSGLALFAQLYLFQPLLAELQVFFSVPARETSLAVSCATLGMAAGLLFFLFVADMLDRRRLMAISLLVAAILTLVTSWASSFPLLLLLTTLKGFVLSGVSAVALSYLNEELDPSTIGFSISLYLSGNTVGGMYGRVLAGLVASSYSWRVATLTIAISSLVCAVAFIIWFPKSRHFVPTNLPIRIRLARMGIFLSHPFFLALFLVASIIMGCFIAIYNYVSFVLTAPPYGLPRPLVAAIFVLYLMGIVGSIWFGKLSDRHRPQRLLVCALLVLIGGMLLMAIPTLVTIILGLMAVTFAFGAGHTLASRLVSTHAAQGKSSATCLYWLFYYLGSSLAGYLLGYLFFAWGWEVLLASTVALGLIALLLAKVFLTSWREPDASFRLPGP